MTLPAKLHKESGYATSASRVERKPTELGLLPADWAVKPVSAFARPVRGASPRPAGDPRYFNGSYIPWLTVAALTNLRDTTLEVTETESCLTEEGSLYSRTLVPGTVIVANSGATLGVAKILGLKCCANDGVAALLELSNEVHPHYLVYFFNSKLAYLREVVARGNGQPNLNTALIGNFRVALPPPHEQEAIAATLREVDAYIDALSELTTKKRATKQGVMQELLSGRRRLPGFQQSWDEKSFTTIFDFLPTATNARADLSENGDCFYVHYGDIHTRFHGHLDFSRTSPPRISRRKCRRAAALREGDWIMADASEDYAGVGKSIEIRRLPQGIPAVAGLHTFLLREKTPTFVPGFKGHLGYLNSLRNQYMRVMTGMKVFGVSKTALRDLVLPVPPPDEQNAIVEFLDGMDDEIAELDRKLAKARQIKQGLMQELLTGRTRLI